MSFVTLRRATIVAALAALAGCSSSGSTSSPVTPSHDVLGTMRALKVATVFVHAGVPYAAASHRVASNRGVHPNYPTKKPLLFEGDQAQNAVNIYKIKALASNPAPIATIPNSGGCPYGMAIDKTGTLYVAGNCGGSTITEYPKGSTTPSLTISNGVSNPLGVALDSSGNLWVSNYPGALTEYAPGGTSPIQTLGSGTLQDPFGVAIDKNNNVFVADFGASQVFELPNGSTTLMPLNLQSLTEPLGVAFDQEGNLWVTDGSGARVQVYAPGSTTPSRTLTGFSFPYAINISPKDTSFISDIGPHVVYAYKKGASTPYATLSNGISLPTGLTSGK